MVVVVVAMAVVAVAMVTREAAPYEYLYNSAV